MTYKELNDIAKKTECKICIFGAGLLGRTLSRKMLETAGCAIDFFCDNNTELLHHNIDGIMVISPNELKEVSDNVIIFISPLGRKAEMIFDQLQCMGIDSNKLFQSDYGMVQGIIESIIEAGDDAAKSQWEEFINEEKYLSWRFESFLGYKLNLDHPLTFNEKMQWLKIHNRNPRYTDMVDKVAAKDIAAKEMGYEKVIETIGVWNNPDEIVFDEFPDEFVLKTTHDSGGTIICKEKSTFDIAYAKAVLKKALKKNHYYYGCEWPYKDVRPRILAEKYMSNPGREVLDVYKVMCFNGQPMIIQVVQNDKTSKETVDYFDTDWNRLPFSEGYPNSNAPLKKPEKLSDMIYYSSVFARDIPFIRVDFYEIQGKIYFSEFTFFNNSGFCRFYPEEWDRILGDMLSIQESKD